MILTRAWDLVRQLSEQSHYEFAHSYFGLENGSSASEDERREAIDLLAEFFKDPQTRACRSKFSRKQTRKESSR
jgi:hypothetical protein